MLPITVVTIDESFRRKFRKGPEQVAFAWLWRNIESIRSKSWATSDPVKVSSECLKFMITIEQREKSFRFTFSLT